MVPELREPSYGAWVEAFNLPILEERRLRGYLITRFKYLKQIDDTVNNSLRDLGIEQPMDVT